MTQADDVKLFGQARVDKLNKQEAGARKWSDIMARREEERAEHPIAPVKIIYSRPPVVVAPEPVKVETPSPVLVSGAFIGQSNTDPAHITKRAKNKRKRTSHRRKILNLLLDGEHISREDTQELYGVRNVGECVRLIRKGLGKDEVLSHENAEGVFEYYCMPAATIAKVKANRESLGQ